MGNPSSCVGREGQRALSAPSTRLAEEGAEALLLRGFGVILGEKKPESVKQE